MSELLSKPSVASHAIGAPFFQSVDLIDDNRTLGTLTWMAPADLTQGAMQVCDIRVDPAHRRKGYGHALLEEAKLQAAELFRARESTLRRVWLVVAQKTDMTARSFLTQEGFHHVATIGNVLCKQDALVYSKGLD